MTKRYWLFKTEPSTYSIDDLKEAKGGKDIWDGVRNFQARNFLRDEVRKGDLVFIYHSSCKVPGIAGLAKVLREKCPDPTSWDKKSPYYDPKSTKDSPRWFMVEVMFVKKFKNLIPLELLKKVKGLNDFQLLKRGNRLSIMPVNEKHSEIINDLLKKA